MDSGRGVEYAALPIQESPRESRASCSRIFYTLVTLVRPFGRELCGVRLVSLGWAPFGVKGG